MTMAQVCGFVLCLFIGLLGLTILYLIWTKQINLNQLLSEANGDASMVLDASLPERLDRNSCTYVTLFTNDLGALQSLTVQFVNAGATWYLDHVQVDSFRFGVSKVATFQRWIDDSGPFTQPFA